MCEGLSLVLMQTAQEFTTVDARSSVQQRHLTDSDVPGSLEKKK